MAVLVAAVREPRVIKAAAGAIEESRSICSRVVLCLGEKRADVDTRDGRFGHSMMRLSGQTIQHRVRFVR